MIIEEQNYLAHYGILRKSGRYPWGSGGPEFASNKGFLDMVSSMHKQGMSDTEIARGLGISTTALRASKSIAKNEEKAALISQVQRMKDKGMSNMAISRQLDLNESSIRSLLEPGAAEKVKVLTSVSDMLADQVAKKEFVDIGAGVEQHLGISKEKLASSVAILKEKGYEVHSVQVDQLGTRNKTIVKVLTPPGTTYPDVAKNKDKIQQVDQISIDGGRSFTDRLKPAQSVDLKRVAVRYAKDGGSDADGVIYVRPGVDDLSLGSSRYAQVRIAVNGTHYLKGMAVYKDDLPKGVDLMFNTNKSDTGDKLDAMKPLKVDKATGVVDAHNPFGAAIDRQNKSAVMNIVNEEGSWEKWSRNLSSQMLSKQSPALAKQQLGVTLERRQKDLEEILSLTNPAVKKKLLEAYADGTDSASVHLKAAAIPRSSSHVILPVDSLKETEVYAPNFRDGERVVLVRYPHGGKFEIPELTVNNRNPEARTMLSRGGQQAKDAIGINAKVAARLSGADFDGDTVLVIPNTNRAVKTEPALAKLKGFDPQAAYPAYDGMPKMSAKTKGHQMGLVSNLITDMTIKGAPNEELVRAVRHSMVVIDAEKHNLNYKQSALDNGISSLMKKYQDKSGGGSATLISRATARIDVPDRKLRSAAKGGPIDPVTGKKVYEETGVNWVNKTTGKVEYKTNQSVKLAETENAHDLSSDTAIERVYADHSNALKGLANIARLETLRAGTTPVSKAAKVAYANEVTELNAALNLAMRNKPLERQAQIIANTQYKAKLDASPEMEDAEKKKIKGQALLDARMRTGAEKQQIQITDAQWHAIQAGAISNHKLDQILQNADLDRVRQLATPRTALVMTPSATARAKSMASNGYTQAEIADALGVSVSSIKASIGGKEDVVEEDA